MACHRRCPHLFVSGQMLSEKGRAFPKARARPIHTHPLPRNHLLQSSFCPPPCPYEAAERCGKKWKQRKLEVARKALKTYDQTAATPQSLLAAGFALQPAHNTQDVRTVRGGLRATGEQKTPSCMKRGTVQRHAVLTVTGKEWSAPCSSSLQILFGVLA